MRNSRFILRLHKKCKVESAQLLYLLVFFLHIFRWLHKICYKKRSFFSQHFCGTTKNPETNEILIQSPQFLHYSILRSRIENPRWNIPFKKFDDFLVFLAKTLNESAKNSMAVEFYFCIFADKNLQKRRFM